MTTSAVSGSLLDRAIDDSSLAPVIRVSAAIFAVALTATAAQVTMPIPFTAVPFVLTPLVVLLAGAALGPRLGAVTQIAYLAAGVAGLPVFAPSAILPPGAARLMGPTGGYLMAYPLAAFVAGTLAARGWDRRYVTSALGMTAGLLVIFAGGVAWLMVAWHQSVGAALAGGFTPFIVADLLKVAVAAMILPQVWKLFHERPSR
jgi:biotin transport system substrate-specific component